MAFIDVSYNQLKGEIPQGTQITGQSKSSFKGNAGPCGLPLLESCASTSVPPLQDLNQEEEGEVLSWKAVAIGYAPGLLFGLALGRVIASYKPKWYLNIVSPDKRKEVKPVRFFASLDSRWDSYDNHVEHESDT